MSGKDRVEVFVLVCERDTFDPLESTGAIILEQKTTTANSPTDLESHPLRLSGKLGRTRIAKLQFIEEWK